MIHIRSDFSSGYIYYVIQTAFPSGLAGIIENMGTAYLGLGSNLGDRLNYLQQAVNGLACKGVVVTKVSRVYETKPWETTPGPDYLNAVIEVQTDHRPNRLLQICQAVENELGRERSTLWAPRSIDVDILIYDDDTIQTPELTVPHPHLAERAFVLVPLNEIAPKLILQDGRSVKDLLAHEMNVAQEVRVYADGVLSLPSA